jgi:hypothetical protein
MNIESHDESRIRQLVNNPFREPVSPAKRHKEVSENTHEVEKVERSPIN